MTTTQNPAIHTKGTIRVGKHIVEVARLATTPTLRSPVADDETAYISALRHAASTGQLPGEPPPSFARALARAGTDSPEVATTRIRTAMVTNLTDTADIAVVRTAFSPFTVLPGEQPRGGSAGGRPGQVREPREGFDTQATQLGLRVLAFNDPEHLRAWCADALSRSLTRAIKRGRPGEIAATGVRRPVLAAMTLVQFTDGTASQWIPMISDGISRLAVCGAGLLDRLDDDPVLAAHAIAQVLLPVTGLKSTSPAHELARRMRRNHQTFVAEYRRHLDAEDGPDESGVRMRQFLTLPADLHLLATDPASRNPHPMESAMEVVVSDQHTGVDGWGHEDDSLHTTLRALKRLVNDGHLDHDFFDLYANRTDLRDSGLLESSTDHHERADNLDHVDNDRLLLRRAVTLMAALLGQPRYRQLKAALMTVSGRRSLTMHQVIDFVAPLVCEPWGTLKPITRAWAYGGPVPTWIRDTSLKPAHPNDYLTLVEIALSPTAPIPAVTAARLELALAGGTALIADGVLTSALVGGSGSARTPLPFRASVNATVEALTLTEEGLTALAVAANHFHPSRSATTARLPSIDLDQPDRVARDGVGMPIRTTETILANYAAQGHTATDEPDPAEASTEPTPLQNLQARAQHLPSDTRALLRNVELTKALHDETGGPSGLSNHDLDAVHDSLSQALKLAGRLT
jgi:hypothetical protein